MKLKKIETSPGFKSIYNNKILLKSLESISNHPASFIAGTTLVMSSIVRPIAISLTPKTDKETKKYAAADSIASGIVKFGITEALAIPIENAVKKIEKNPEKFLQNKTINTLKEKGKTLTRSKNYEFAQQLIKLGTGFISAIPKSMISVALIPIIMDTLFTKKQKNKKQILYKQKEYNPVFSPFYDNKISFKGINNITAKGVGHIFDSEILQKFVKSQSKNEVNIAKNISLATDVLLAGSYIINTKKSKNIEKEKKNPLIFNKLISTGISVFAGYQIDELVQKGSKKFIEKFKEINIQNPKLDKYIQGINVLRPTIIFAGIYYGVLPMFSTFISDKLDNLTKKKTK